MILHREVVVVEFIVPEWVGYILFYLVFGVAWAVFSIHNDWDVTIDFRDYPLWPWFIVFWLPIVVLTSIGMIGYGIVVILFKENIIPKFKYRYSRFKYRKEVRKHRPKYGYK